MESLELPEFKVLHIDINDEYRIYEVEPVDKPFACSSCMYADDVIGYVGKFKPYDARVREVMDVNDIDGRKVVIRIHLHRYLCPLCHKVFTPNFEAICRKDRVTRRLWKRMGREVLLEKNSFYSVGRRYGVSPTTVNRAFKEHVAELDRDRTLKAPTILGIDEVYVRTEDSKKKQALAVFTDIENGKLLEIIKGNERDDIIGVIKSMEGYEGIKAVTMDMNKTYKVAVEMCLPDAYTVIDHYHVIQKTCMALDTIRASIYDKLLDGQKDDLFKVRNMIRANRENLTQDKIAKLDAQLDLYPKLKLAKRKPMVSIMNGNVRLMKQTNMRRYLK